MHRQDDSDDDAMVITHGQPPRRGGTREEGPNNTSEVQSEVENGGTDYQEAVQKELEKLRAEFHQQQERTKHQMTVKQEVAVVKQAVAKEIFPSYKFVTHEGTMEPMGAIASHVRKRLGYDNMKEEAWKNWWFSVGGKTVLSEIRNHRSNVTAHMKSVYCGEYFVGNSW